MEDNSNGLKALDDNKKDVENPNNINYPINPNGKPKIVVIMGASGSGKSRLAIDLASHFPIEIINADSMQVYQGLDVLTNKVPLEQQKGVPHHLLGTISANVEFTAKEFRDYAIPLIDDILSRSRVPVIVGGTNYYIQSLVSPFLLNDSADDMDDNFSMETQGDKQPDSDLEFQRESFSCNYDYLKEIDPLAANRLHPNDHRKINQYLNLYAQHGVLPSKLLQAKVMENWGRVDNFRYNCCFICVDASLSVLDEYVGQRVDCMIDAGLLNEVYDIYNSDANYTRGLRQAIGVREFEEFLRVYLSEDQNGKETDLTEVPRFQIRNRGDKILKEDISTILSSSERNQLKLLLAEAIEKVKTNTRRLVRRQKRRINRLQTLFGWNIHFVDATESLLCFSDASWSANVVEPSVKIITSHLNKDKHVVFNLESENGAMGLKLNERDLWTQHICKACGDRVLRGAHEWEQHKQGRGHRKRVYRLKKSGIPFTEE